MKTGEAVLERFIIGMSPPSECILEAIKLPAYSYYHLLPSRDTNPSKRVFWRLFSLSVQPEVVKKRQSPRVRTSSERKAPVSESTYISGADNRNMCFNA